MNLAPEITAGPKPAWPRVALRGWRVLPLLLATCALAWGLDTSKLKPSGYVNDFAGGMDANGKRALEDYCARVERATGAQLAFVTVKTLEEEPIEDVANRLFREWAIGKRGKDEGLLVLLAVDDRKNRAEVGYGLEPIISDGAAGGVLRGLRPLLRQNDYSGALLAAAQQYGAAIAQSKGVTIEGTPPMPPRAARGRDGGGIPVPLIILGIIFLFFVFGRSGRGGGGFRGGGAGDLVAGMILGNMMGRRGGGWNQGGFGGGGGGWGEGGGFGGFGGGSSGGGGASSDW